MGKIKIFLLVVYLADGLIFLAAARGFGLILRKIFNYKYKHQSYNHD